MDNKKWRSLIGNIETNWYSQNESIYRNSKYINRKLNILLGFEIFMVFLLEYITTYMETKYSYWILNVFTGICIVVPFLVMIIIFKKVNHNLINDDFYIIKQFKYVAIVIIIMTVLVILFKLIGFVTQKYYENSALIFQGIIVTVLVMFVPVLLLVNTLWVIKYVIPKVNKKSAKTDGGNMISMKEILNNSFAMDIFMSHLSHGLCVLRTYIQNILSIQTTHLMYTEFSMELLISYIEFIQYQVYCGKKFNITFTDDKIREFPNIEYSYTISKYDNDTSLTDIDKCICIAVELFNKYIKIGCKHEINISYISRLKLINLLTNDEYLSNINMNEQEISNIFKNASNEVYKLMGYSLSRLYSKPNIVKLLYSCFNDIN